MARKLIAYVFILIVSTGIAFGQCPLTFKGAERAHIGVYVAPVGTGSKTLIDYNSQKLFTPASVMKAVTSAAVLSRYGGDFRWKTTVVAVGNMLPGGVLNGNVIITGSGDPTLGSEQFKDERYSTDFLSVVRNEAAKCGIKSIEGRVEEGGPQWPDQGPVPSWELEDIPGVDGAGFYSLNFSDNIFVLSYPSLKTYPHIPNLNVCYRGGSGSLSFYRNSGSNDLSVYGQLGRKQKRASLKCSMPYPPKVLLTELDSLFHARNLDVKLMTDTVMRLDYQSPPLRDVVRSLMVRSDNQMAEASLRLLAPRESRAKAIAAERSLLTDLGVDISGVRVADGSGLSRHNVISPAQIGKVLSLMARSGD